jgi:hypothetical protein
MAVFVSLFGFFLVIVGLFGIAATRTLIALVGRWRAARLLAVGASLRVALGVIFLLAAPYCRQPLVVRIVGVVSLVAALALLAVGPSRFERFLDRWLARPPGLMRGWLVVALALGALLVWASGWPS